MRVFWIYITPFLLLESQNLELDFCEQMLMRIISQILYFGCIQEELAKKGFYPNCVLNTVQFSHKENSVVKRNNKQNHSRGKCPWSSDCRILYTSGVQQASLVGLTITKTFYPNQRESVEFIALKGDKNWWGKGVPCGKHREEAGKDHDYEIWSNDENLSPGSAGRNEVTILQFARIRRIKGRADNV